MIWLVNDTLCELNVPWLMRVVAGGMDRSPAAGPKEHHPMIGA